MFLKHFSGGKMGMVGQQTVDALHHKIYGYRTVNHASITIPVYMVQTSNYYDDLTDIVDLYRLLDLSWLLPP